MLRSHPFYGCQTLNVDLQPFARIHCFYLLQYTELWFSMNTEVFCSGRMLLICTNALRSCLDRYLIRMFTPVSRTSGETSFSRPALFCSDSLFPDLNMQFDDQELY